MDSPPAARTGRRIKTWKGIAHYLGVAERTAQLWVRTRGLPVRRLPGARGGVYAIAEELDAWMQSERAELEAAKSLRNRYRRTFVSIAILALAAAAALSATAWPRLRARWVRPVSARFEGEVLVAYDAEGKELWRRRPEPPPGLSAAALNPEGSVAVLADLDGGGSRDVLALEQFQSGKPGDLGVSRFDVLSRTTASGRLVWKRAPDCGLLDAEGRRFTPAWWASSLLTARHGGRDRAWVTLSHRDRFPGVVAEVMPDGALRMLFANHGHVNSLATVESEGRLWLVAGGSTNALKGAFLALLDPAKGFSKAPDGGPARYRMANAAEADPAVYFYIPRVDLTEATLSDVNTIYTIEARPGGLLARVQVGAAEGCQLRIEFDLPLEPRVVRVTSACGIVHRLLERRKVLDHSFDRCPDFQQPLRLQRWRPGEGWRTVTVPVATMRNTI
ncbi:MAG: helix-turn-helix domain-containing protein [Bryobacteraceae bacterium]|nr:helix-turn-helix domain-containing protein [Bryobacteraceae bacterium]